MEELSSYELERRENMRQNFRRLCALGLADEADDPDRQTRTQPRRAPAKRPRPERSAEPPRPLRRSTRKPSEAAASSAADSGSGAAADDDDAASVNDADFINDDDDDDDDAPPRRAPRPAGPPKERPPPDARSTRAIKVDAAAFVDAHLGRQIPGPPTKESVVTLLNGGKRPTFSKYGTTEWRNAVVLWVNIGGGDYNNVFLDGEDGGLDLTWFASPRHHEGTPLVHRLLSAAPSDTVLLFCRLLEPGSSSKYEPYVCCGRLQYASHDGRRQPIKFVWRLRDAAALRKTDGFKDVLAAAKRGR